MDWPDVIHQLVAIRDSAMRRLLHGEQADWGPHEENTARLLDVQTYALDWRWSEHTSDPNDPEVRRERAEALMKGIRPPRKPFVPPVAERPEEMAEQRLTAYLERVAEHFADKTRESVSLDEFDRVIDAM